MHFNLAAVSFYIRLVNHINAVFIAQVEESRVGRIMRSTNAVYIILLKNRNILFHILNGHSISGFGICVVMIYSEKFNIFIIKSKNIACYSDMLKADIMADKLNHLTLQRKRQHESIKFWVLGGPLVNFKIFKAD